MKTLLKFMSRNEPNICFRFLGVAMLIVGIVTASMDKAFGGWTPIYWFLLSFAAFFGVLCNELYRVVLLLESKKGG
jgi:hypothetical protein